MSVLLTATTVVLVAAVSPAAAAPPAPSVTERLITDAVEDSYDLVTERLPPRS